MHTYNDPSVKHRRQILRTRSTKPEQKLWYYLKNQNLGAKFRRQYSVGSYILDFYCPKHRLAVEVDGGSHFNEIARIKDQTRSIFLAKHKITCIRFTNLEVMDNIMSVLEKIKSYLT